METQELYSLNKLAELTGRDRATIKRILDRTQTPPDGKNKTFDVWSLDTFKSALADYSKLIGDDVGDEDTVSNSNEYNRLLTIKLQKEIDKCVEDIIKKQIENAVARKELLNTEEVYDFLRRFSDGIIDNLFTVFNQLPNDATGLSTAELRKIYDEKKRDIVIAVAAGVQKFRTKYAVVSTLPIEALNDYSI